MIYLLPTLLLFSPQTALFQANRGQLEEVISNYNEHIKETGEQDIRFLQELGLQILEKGLSSNDEQVQMAALFGAGVSLHERLSQMMLQGLSSRHAEIQLVALSQLTRIGHKESARALELALKSDFLPIRLEALYMMAEMRDPKAVGQTEAIMQKTPEELWPYYAPIFAKSQDRQGKAAIKRMMIHSNPNIRMSAILQAAANDRHDLLPEIRMLATHTHTGQKEVCALALGRLKDAQSIPLLEKLKLCQESSVRLTALKSLYDLGKVELAETLFKEAMTENPFAISLLADIEGANDTLFTLAKSTNAQTRYNAALALLKLKDSRSLAFLKELLIATPKDVGLIPIQSQGHAISAVKAIYSAAQTLSDNASLLELSLRIKEQLLVQSALLNEEVFLGLAKEIFQQEANDLVPTTIALLENLKTPASIALLKQEQQRLGAPLIRNFCTLALFRMGEEGPYEKELKLWVKSQMRTPLFRFRPLITRQMSQSSSPFELTPDESSQLLVQVFEAFSSLQEDRGFSLLLEAIANGHPQNRYPLAGLLVRATQ